MARDSERALARFGLLGEGAAPRSPPARDPRWPGCCLADTGLLACARTVYGWLRNGFYGLETMLVMLVFCALLREPRAEGATRVSLAALGWVLGLDRAPEVKTIRRKLGELAAAGRAEQLQMAIARHHATARPDQLGFFYIDGHAKGGRTSAPGTCRRCTWPGSSSPPRAPRKPGSPTVPGTRCWS